MQVMLNGAARPLAEDTSVTDLLEQLGLRAGSVVVELNGTALLPSEVPGTRLADGDRIELVKAVAGG